MKHQAVCARRPLLEAPHSAVAIAIIKVGTVFDLLLSRYAWAAQPP